MTPTEFGLAILIALVGIIMVQLGLILVRLGEVISRTSPLGGQVECALCGQVECAVTCRNAP